MSTTDTTIGTIHERAAAAFHDEVEGMARMTLERGSRDFLIRAELVSKSKAKDSSWEFVEFCDELLHEFVRDAATQLAEFIAEKQGASA